MSTDTKVTVTGWVGTQPKHFVSESGTDFTSFRLASTKRFFNRAENSWTDGPTTWFSVKAWRSTAINIAESLRKSDPVVVHGTLTSETWDSPEGPRTTFVIEVDALGPDLARGQASFRHTVHTKAGEAAEAGAESETEKPEGERASGHRTAAPTDPWAVPPADGPAGSDDGGEPGTSASAASAAGSPEQPGDETDGTDTGVVAAGRRKGAAQLVR